MTTPHPEDTLPLILQDAIDAKWINETHAKVLLERLFNFQIDMMLDLAAAKHEVEALTEQRNATRQYLGVALSDTDDEDQELLGPEAILRLEVKRIVNEVGIDKKIQCIKDLRSSAKATDAWAKLGNGLQTGVMGNAHLGLKEAKDVIDAYCQNRLYLGAKGYVNL